MLVDGGRQKIIDAVEQTEGFEKTVVRGDDGQVLRVLSPGKATGVDAMSATYLGDYIDEAWTAYADKKSPWCRSRTSRRLCAALHRGTLGESSQEPVTDAGKFYQRDLTNHFSAIVHANMKGGKAYGFAFDDVTGQESLVHSGGPGEGLDHPGLARVRPRPDRAV